MAKSKLSPPNPANHPESPMPESYGASQFQSFQEFYPYYLSEHAQPSCRLLHFIGSTIVLFLILSLFSTGSWWTLLYIPLAGYGFAWIGHFFIEKNRPATFQYPLYSLMGDWVMYKDILAGKISII